MTEDLSGLPDGRETMRGMGWDPLPYGCVGLIRKSLVGSHSVWSWLILIPWATDSKPWIDGNKVVSGVTKTDEMVRGEILSEMRQLLDDRYGEAMGNEAIDDLIRRLQDGG
jgi:hypothetical protein